MTETLQDPLPPPPPPPPPAADQHRLARDPDDRVVAGVCAGLGRYTATDPVLWRVTTGVLTVFGGAGLVLYALGWVLIPRTGADASFAERTLRRPDRSVSIGGAILLGVLAVVLLGLLDLRGPALVSLVVIGGVVLLVARERRAGAVPPAPQQVWDPTAAPSSYGVPSVGPDGTTASYAGPPAYLPPYVPPVPRERSVLGPVTLSVAALVAGVLLLLGELGVDGITAPRVLAAATLVVGAGLVVGTWLGRARWLALIGAGLLLVLVPTAALQGLEGGVGERSWVPQSAQQAGTYRLGVGEAVLDLRTLEPGSVTALRARVGAGLLIVLVPDDLRLRVRPDIGVGSLVTTGPEGRTSQDTEPFDDVRYPDVVLGPAGGSELVLDAEVGLGELEVRRVAS